MGTKKMTGVGGFYPLPDRGYSIERGPNLDTLMRALRDHDWLVWHVTLAGRGGPGWAMDFQVRSASPCAADGYLGVQVMPESGSMLIGHYNPATERGRVRFA